MIKNKTPIAKYIFKTYLQIFTIEDQSKIISWLDELILQIKQKKDQKVVVETATEDAYLQMSFIQMLDIQMLEENNLTEATNSEMKGDLFKKAYDLFQPSLFHSQSAHSFEIMDKALTQAQWVKIMKNNPAVMDSSSSEWIQTISIDGNNVVLRPDLAMNGVSQWDAMVFANRLSELKGLEAVYDLSECGLEQKPNGSWQARNPQLIKIHAPNGNLYEAEGYRLPTGSEMALMLRSSMERAKIFRESKGDRSSNWLYAVDDQFFLPSIGGQNFYFAMDTVEYLSKNSEKDPMKKFVPDSSTHLQVTSTGYISYDLYLNPKALDSGGRGHHFRLARTLFKSKEGAQP